MFCVGGYCRSSNRPGERVGVSTISMDVGPAFTSPHYLTYSLQPSSQTSIFLTLDPVFFFFFVLTMAAPLHLHLASLEDDDPWIVEQKYFMILNNSLQPDSQVSAAEAAAGINELTPMNREANGEEAEEPESWCLEFWGTINELVKQIPHDHPSQDKMVEIIKELKALPGVEVSVCKTVSYS